ncbi:MAG: N-acetylneuraminate synthase family protein, partial [Parvibaculaceae bacterium]
ARKEATGELTNLDKNADMARDGRPVLLSTGMSAWQEIDAAVGVVRQGNAPFAIFQCTTQYPSPPEAIGLNVLDELRSRYGCAVGLSDHSGTIYPALAAAAAHRAQVIEVHLTLSRDMFGPDVPASLIPSELGQLCDGVRFIETMRASPVDKATMSDAVSAMRKVFFKSVVALDDLAAGTVLRREQLGLKKPGTGIPAADIGRVVGRKLKRAVKGDVPLRQEDLE